MNKKLLSFIILAVVVVLGFLLFWYYRETIFSTEILHLEISGPTQAKMGEEIEYKVTYKNNGNFLLENPKLVFELPEHSLTEDGKGRISQDLENLRPGDERTSTFTLRLLGKEGDIKTAKAWLSYKPHNLSVRYESYAILETTIEAVPVTLTYDLPSKIEQGKPVQYSINYFSNVDYPLENMSVRVTPLPGFVVESALPASLDNAEWKLEVLEKSKGGRITINGMLNMVGENPLPFSARLGMWVGGIFVVVKEVKQPVDIIMPSPTPALTVTQALQAQNDGLYAVRWQIINEVAAAKNVRVKAILPVGTTLGDYIFPENQADYFSWDVASRQIVWLVGDMPVGAGFSLDFQVTPLQGQVPITQVQVVGESQQDGSLVQGVVKQ